MTVSTYYSRSRQGKALFWPDDVYDALAFVTKTEIGKAECLDVLLKRQALKAGIGFFDELANVLEVFA